MRSKWRLFGVVLLLCSFAEALPSYLKPHMNLSANPCEDFYAYACGGWPQAHEGGDYSSQMEQLDHMYHVQLHEILEQQAPATEPRFVRLLRNNYAACRQLRVNYEPAQYVRMLRELMSPDTVKIEQEGGMTPLLRLLLKFGGLNYIRWHKEDDNIVELTELEQWLQKLQLLWPHIGKDSEEWQANKTALLPLTHEQFGQLYHALQPLGEPEEKLRLEVMALDLMFWEMVRDVRNKEQSEVQEEQQLEELQEALEVQKEQQLQHTQWVLEVLKRNQSISIDLFGTIYEKWDYQSWLPPVPAPIRNLFRLLITLPPLLREVPLEVLERYLLLRLLHRLQQMPPLNLSPLECAAHTRLLLPHAADWLLEQQLSPEQRQQRHHHVKRVFAQLRQQFRQQLLANRNSFDNATQHFLLGKLQGMRLRLGLLPTGEQPPLLDAAEEQQLLEQHHAPLQLNASDYFGNLLAIFRQSKVWTQQQSVEALQDRRALLSLLPLDFGTYASPFYMPMGNLLVLPPSLLAPPIYRAFQRYRLSSLGFLMAHEMSHSLAPTDVLYDGRGDVASDNMVNSARFVERIRCLWSSYPRQIDEKFADLNGISLAYKAYMATTTASLPQQQSFFISFAQFFCRAEEQEQLYLLEMDTHGSNRERVNDAVGSLEGFQSAFGCSHYKANSQCELFD